jgi:hypothetical protein
MLINEVYETVLDLNNSDQIGGYLAPERYNQYAEFAQNAILNELQELLDYNQRTISLLSDVLKVATVEVGADGYVSLPTDYMLYADANAVLFDDGKFREYPVDMIGKSERGERLRSKIVMPEIDYPIATEDNTGLLIEPTEVQRIKLTYIYLPEDPEWVGDGSVPPVFDPDASTDFAFGQKFKNILVYKILRYMGVEIREPFLLQATTDNLIKQFQGQPTN